MKNLIFLGLILLLSCNNQQKENNSEINLAEKQTSAIKENKESENQQICWKGKLNSKINILLHYQIQGDIVTGQIVYTDTKEQTPIRIIGAIEEDNSIRLLEFENTGNVTGIITGLPKENEFTGSWFSPETREEMTMILSRADTLINAENIETNIENITGDYHYQFSEEGNIGDLTIKKVNPDKISISINSVTEAPGRNIAEIETDTVKAATDLIYKVPETDSCEFRVRFFKDFAYVNYTKGNCDGVFGRNATIDGIFYKQK